MSRVSDTRQRTRQAAEKFVAAGRRPHEITVDLVYAEIRQGSRTTINDELKLWKDEQAKIDALSAALPAPVANAMLAVWAAAVEHGECVFDERRAEVEEELTQTTARADAAQIARVEADALIETLQKQLELARTETLTAQTDMQRERDAKNAAQRRATDSEGQLAAKRAEAQDRLNAQREAYEQQLQQQQDTLATSEAKLRNELARATERLEGVQKHVMMQVAQAREAQKHAEVQLLKTQQRYERLSDEAAVLREKGHTLTMQLQRAVQDCDRATKNAARWQAERDELTIQLATTNGRLESTAQQVADLLAQVGLQHGSEVASPTATARKKQPRTKFKPPRPL